MQYHYGEGWVTFYYRFSMSAYEARQRGLVSFLFNSMSGKHINYLDIRDWLEENVGIEGTDWYYDIHKDNKVWFGFHKKSHAELFRLVWG